MQKLPSVGLTTGIVDADLNLPLPTKWTEAGSVGGVRIYPIKSCMGVDVEEAQATLNGLRSADSCLIDRHFVITDKKNKMITGRKHPQVVLVEPSVVADAKTGEKTLALNAPGMEEVRVRLPSRVQAAKINEEKLELWLPCMGIDLGREVGEWLSTFLLDREDAGLKYLNAYS